MTAQPFTENLAPVEAMSALMARHGVLRVLIALPVAVLTRRRKDLLLPQDLSPHLMRDIGMGPGARSGKSWELG
jgi:hypothetical protein